MGSAGTAMVPCATERVGMGSAGTAMVPCATERVGEQEWAQVQLSEKPQGGEQHRAEFTCERSASAPRIDSRVFDGVAVRMLANQAGISAPRLIVGVPRSSAIPARADHHPTTHLLARCRAAR